MSKKLKIAVQFFGHLRTYQKCAPSIKKNLLDLYDCDVFMHTWSQTDSATKTWHNQKGKIKDVDQTVIEEIKQLYNLKNLQIEQQNIPQNDKTRSAIWAKDEENQISVAGMNFMLYSQTKVNKLRQQYQKENNTIYDYVVMIRPDIALYSDFDLARWNAEISASIHYPARFCAVNAFANPKKKMSFVSDIMSDILYFARPKAMDQIITVLEKLDFGDENIPMWNPESLITNTLFQSNISTLNLYFYTDRDWNIVRQPQKNTNLRKKIIRLKFSKGTLSIRLFSTLNKTLLSLHFSILNLLTIDLIIGNKICLR